MITWRIDAQIAAGNEDDAAKPVWARDIPWCSPQCPHRDIFACKLTGVVASRVCEPVVAQMSKLLSAGPVKP
jgi:hypothetical protein